MSDYAFYGWQTADIREAHGLTPRDVYDLLRGLWCARTCAPRMRADWRADNPTLGQCSVTAFLAQDLFGGQVFGVPLPEGGVHCFNVVGACVFDLTSEQFGGRVLDYAGATEQLRAVHFEKEEKRQRYELLRAGLMRRLRAETAPRGPRARRTFVIVGSGYRSEYFGRVAAAYPELFGAIYLCRSEEKAALMRRRTGLAATTSVETCLALQPDWAVIAVDRGHVAEVAEEWLARGIPVVTETPVGDTPEKLERLWQWGQRGGRIVCCEQYLRQPILAAGLAAVEEGLIGTPASLYISLLHDYHGASLIRRALRVAPDEPYTLHAMRQTGIAVETDSRGGAFWDGRTRATERDAALIAFESGKTAIYDFCPIQYRSYIRSRHLTVRGDRGEWSDTQIRYLDADNCPRQRFLLPELPPAWRCLDTQALRDRRRSWTADLAPDTVQDELAIAALLLDMDDYLSGGPSPYPLEEAMADAWFWLSLQEAVARPCQEVRSHPMPWRRREGPD